MKIIRPLEPRKFLLEDGTIWKLPENVNEIDILTNLYGIYALPKIDVNLTDNTWRVLSDEELMRTEEYFKRDLQYKLQLEKENLMTENLFKLKILMSKDIHKKTIYSDQKLIKEEYYEKFNEETEEYSDKIFEISYEWQDNILLSRTEKYYHKDVIIKEIKYKYLRDENNNYYTVIDYIK